MSDIDTAAADRLKALDPTRLIESLAPAPMDRCGLRHPWRLAPPDARDRCSRHENVKAVSVITGGRSRGVDSICATITLRQQGVNSPSRWVAILAKIGDIYIGYGENAI